MRCRYLAGAYEGEEERDKDLLPSPHSSSILEDVEELDMQEREDQKRHFLACGNIQRGG